MATMADTIFPDSHVGFDSITSQIERKLLKRGFQFNIICVGTFRPQNDDSRHGPRRRVLRLRSTLGARGN